MVDFIANGILILVCLQGVQAGDYCNIGSTLTYCDWGCCYDDPSVDHAHCCPGQTASVVIIAVVGALGGIAAIVSAIVAVRCCVQKNTRDGVIEQQASTPGAVSSCAYPAYDIANTTVFYEAHRIPITQSKRYTTDGRTIDPGLTIHIPEPPSYPEVLRMNLESAGRK